MQKFYINITAKNKKELEERIKDNESRGFSLYKLIEPEIRADEYFDYNVDSHGIKKYRKSGNSISARQIFKAVMVRESRKAVNI